MFLPLPWAALVKASQRGRIWNEEPPQRLNRGPSAHRLKLFVLIAAGVLVVSLVVAGLMSSGTAVLGLVSIGVMVGVMYVLTKIESH